MRTLVVLPTYNEAENIEEAIRRVRAAVPAAGILVVDDNSPDGTAALAERVGAELDDVAVLRRAEKRGLGSAYRAGFADAGIAEGAEVLVEMDADLSHPAAELPALLAAVAHGADLAIGSRYVPGGSIPNWSWHRRMLSRWGNRYAAGALGLAVNDATAGYRAYRASALKLIDLDGVHADGYGFQIEMTYRLVRRGGRVVEVPIAFVDRERGTSKMSGRIVVEALGLVTVWAVRDRILRRPPHNGRETEPVRNWLVGGALIERDGEVLLVRNRRRDGSHDWTPPGGVIDEGEALLDGLGREVTEETGLVVGEWHGPLYEVAIEAPGLGWRLRVEVWRAITVAGTLALDDPDGIVVDARFVAAADCAAHLDGVHPWVREPLSDWLVERWADMRPYRYVVSGTDRSSMVVTRQ